MTRRTVAALAFVAVLTSCGVGTEDRPRPIEDTSIPRTPAIPSVASEPASPTTTPSPQPPSVSPTLSTTAG